MTSAPRCDPNLQDSQILDVQPTVFVELGETAKLESGDGAVVIDMIVACPPARLASGRS